MQENSAADYLINFVMQISHGVYLTVSSVKTDLILIFPGHLKKTVSLRWPLWALEFQNLFFKCSRKTL